MALVSPTNLAGSLAPGGVIYINYHSVLWITRISLSKPNRSLNRKTSCCNRLLSCELNQSSSFGLFSFIRGSEFILWWFYVWLNNPACTTNSQTTRSQCTNLLKKKNTPEPVKAKIAMFSFAGFQLWSFVKWATFWPSTHHKIYSTIAVSGERVDLTKFARLHEIKNCLVQLFVEACFGQTDFSDFCRKKGLWYGISSLVPRHTSHSVVLKSAYLSRLLYPLNVVLGLRA